MSSAEEIIPIVDMQDTIIWHKERSAITYDDIYRVSSLVIINPSRNKFILAQRASWKLSPERWANSVDGTVWQGETYRQNIIKEAKEEIGLDVCDDMLREVWHQYVYNPLKKNKFRHTLFLVVCEDDIIDTLVLEDAVAAVRWWGIDEIQQAVQLSPQTFTESFARNFSQLIQWLDSHKDMF